MNFPKPEQGTPIECLPECPFVSSRTPIIHLEIGTIRLMRTRRVIRPSEAQSAQEEKEKKRQIYVTDRIKWGSIILHQSQTMSQACFTLTWPNNYSCPSEQEHMFDLQTKFISSTLNLVSFACVLTLSNYIP